MRGTRCGVRWPHGPGGRACLFWPSGVPRSVWGGLDLCGRPWTGGPCRHLGLSPGLLQTMTWLQASPKMTRDSAAEMCCLPHSRASSDTCPVHWREGGPHEGQAGGPRGRLKGASAGSRSGAACGGQGKPFRTTLSATAEGAVRWDAQRRGML